MDAFQEFETHHLLCFQTAHPDQALACYNNRLLAEYLAMLYDQEQLGRSSTGFLER